MVEEFVVPFVVVAIEFTGVSAIYSILYRSPSPTLYMLNLLGMQILDWCSVLYIGGRPAWRRYWKSRQKFKNAQIVPAGPCVGLVEVRNKVIFVT
jgi:hypothetical protein